MRTALTTVKISSGDTHGANNYIQTLKELLNTARVQIDKELDVRSTDKPFIFGGAKRFKEEGPD